jgi:hypothetical protein
MKSNASEDKSKKAKSIRSFEDFSYDQVHFPSTSDPFRVKCQYLKEKWVIWCENKRSHQQWEGVFKEKSEICPSDVQIPMEIIMSSLSAALANQDDGKGTESSATAAGMSGASILSNSIIDLIKGDDNHMELQLTVQFGPFWSPEFVFKLSTIHLDRVDLLEAQIRDAQEEIVRLNKQLKERDTLGYLSLKSAASAGAGQYFQWLTPLLITDDKFEVGNGFITVKSPGVFVFHFVSTFNSQTGGLFATLEVDNQQIGSATHNVAQTYHQSFGTQYVPMIQAHHIHAISKVNAGSIVKVKHHSSGTPSETNFFIYQISSTI